MRTRVTVFDDLSPDGTLRPTVLQSLDVPMEGRADPGLEQFAGDIRIPGTNIRVRVSFLADETGPDGVAVGTQGFLTDMAIGVHRWARSKGFWNASSNIGEKIALMHSELSEALEDYRHFPQDELRVIQWDQTKPNEAGMPEPHGFGIEMADTIIRIVDTAGYLGIDLDEAVAVKRQYNHNRPHMHGGKRV